MPPRIPRIISARSRNPTQFCTRRHAHGTTPARSIPAPTPFVPDVATFLKLIGRDMFQHASKFPSWEALFLNRSPALRKSGVEPARTRRYFLWWRERFRKGDFGFGGDIQHISDGVAELRIAEREGKKVVINSKPEDTEADLGNRPAQIQGVKVVQPGVIAGPYLEVVKGSYGTVAKLKVIDGMWEVKRGRKVGGGERKRKIQERADKMKREQEQRNRALGIK